MKSKIIALSVIFALCTQDICVYAGALNYKKEFNNYYTYDDSQDYHLIDEQKSAPNNTACSPWAKESIENAISAGIIPDTLQSNYTDKITRKEFCYLAVQTYMAKTGYTIQQSLQTPFTDIDDDYVTTAYMLGIVSGVGNEKFAPGSNITRQEAAVMLNNMAEVSGVDNNRIREEKYTDESHFADWAKDSIYRVSAIYNKETTLMTGTGNGRFSPWMNYTREQAAATMYRLFECSSVPVLVPPRDNNIYCGVYNSETDGDILYCINTDTDSAKALVNNGEYTAIRVCAVSGNEIYYELTYNYRVKQMYKINTDGTGNTALTPQSEQVYLGNRYIYYVPVSAGDTVVRINLDGTSPITADFSVIDKYKVTCVIKVDRNDTIYVRVVTSYPEVDYLYKYDFSDGSMEKIPEDTNIAWMTNNAVYNGKYKFYVYRDFDGVYMNEVRNMGRNELHRCRIDGTNDVVLNKDLLLYEKKGLICLYENKVYVPTDNEGLSVLIYDSNGKSVEICPNPECEKLDYFESSIAFLGTQKGKIYYTYDGKIHCVNSDGTNDKEII